MTTIGYDVGQAWAQHLAAEREWWCLDHGYVSPTERQHGGRAHGFVCPEEGCGHTLINTTVDWAAYHEAKANDEHPPCPNCGCGTITTVPAKPTYRCTDCGHAYGTAGGYY